MLAVTVVYIYTGLDVENHDEKKTRLGSLKKAARNASSRFKESFSRRIRKHSKAASFELEDVHDAEEAKAVDTLRQTLILEELLPSKHDDYHKMLRLEKERQNTLSLVFCISF